MQGSFWAVRKNCAVNSLYKSRWLIFVSPSLPFRFSTFCLQRALTCFLNGYQTKQRLRPYRALTDWVIHRERVYCAVRTEFLNRIQYNFFFAGLDSYLLWLSSEHDLILSYRGADKSLARPRRKQTNVPVRMARISFCALHCRGGKKHDESSRIDVVEIARVPEMLPSLFPSWSG